MMKSSISGCSLTYLALLVCCSDRVKHTIEKAAADYRTLMDTEELQSMEDQDQDDRTMAGSVGPDSVGPDQNQGT